MHAPAAAPALGPATGRPGLPPPRRNNNAPTAAVIDAAPWPRPATEHASERRRCLCIRTHYTPAAAAAAPVSVPRAREAVRASPLLADLARAAHHAAGPGRAEALERGFGGGDWRARQPHDLPARYARVCTRGSVDLMCVYKGTRLGGRLVRFGRCIGTPREHERNLTRSDQNANNHTHTYVHGKQAAGARRRRARRRGRGWCSTRIRS